MVGLLTLALNTGVNSFLFWLWLFSILSFCVACVSSYIGGRESRKQHFEELADYIESVYKLNEDYREIIETYNTIARYAFIFDVILAIILVIITIF